MYDMHGNVVITVDFRPTA